MLSYECLPSPNFITFEKRASSEKKFTSYFSLGFNILCEVVNSQRVNSGNSTINTAALKQGIYIIHIITANGTFSQKMIKQ